MEHYYLCPSDHLAHHGILKQQWGVRRGPPYPLARTSNGRLDTKAQSAAKRRSTQVGGLAHLTINGKRFTKEELGAAWEEKKRARIENKQKRKEEKEAAKALKEKKAAEKKAEQEAAEEAHKKLVEEKVKAAEADKKEALKQYMRHHPTELPKYVDAFTKEEIDEIVSRIELDKKVRQIRNDEIYHYMEYFNKAAEALKATNTTIQNGIGVYNSVASVWNTIGEETQKTKDREKAFAEKKKADPKAKPDDRFRPLPRVGGNNEEADQRKKNNQQPNPDKKKQQK